METRQSEVPVHKWLPGGSKVSIPVLQEEKRRFCHRGTESQRRKLTLSVSVTLCLCGKFHIPPGVPVDQAKEAGSATLATAESYVGPSALYNLAIRLPWALPRAGIKRAFSPETGGTGTARTLYIF